MINYINSVVQVNAAQIIELCHHRANVIDDFHGKFKLRLNLNCQKAEEKNTKANII